MAPSSLAVDPTGQRYLPAYSAKKINDLLEEENLFEQTHQDLIIHEIDENGQIERSYLRVSRRVATRRDVMEAANYYEGYRLFFSPKERAFLRQVREPWLREVSSTLAGKCQVATAIPAVESNSVPV